MGRSWGAKRNRKDRRKMSKTRREAAEAWAAKQAARESAGIDHLLMVSSRNSDR